MPKFFNITTNVTSAALAGGEVPYTVTNVSGRPQRVRAKPVALAATEQTWLSVVGESVRDLSAGASDVITLKSGAPDATKEGDFRARLDVISEVEPEVFEEGSVVELKRAPKPEPAEEKKRKIPAWVPVVAVVAVLAIGGLVAWLALRGGSGEVEVPVVAGMTLDEARAALEKAGLRAAEPATYEVSGAQAPNTVLRTEPAAGASAGRGAAVAVVLEATTVAIPDVRERSFADAVQALLAAGLTPKVQGAPLAASDDWVLDQVPRSGSPAVQGSEVTLVVTPTFPVPNVKGMRTKDARDLLASKGLKVQFIGVVDVQNIDKVINQVPTNERVHAGQTVTLAYGNYIFKPTPTWVLPKF